MPVQTLKGRGDMIKSGTENKSRNVVVNFVEFFTGIFWRASEQSSIVT